MAKVHESRVVFDVQKSKHAPNYRLAILSADGCEGFIEQIKVKNKRGREYRQN